MPTSSSPPRKVRAPASSESRKSLLDVLSNLYCLVQPEDISILQIALGVPKPLSATVVRRIVNDDRSRFEQGKAEQPLLCYGISHDDLVAVKNRIGISDWPIEKRIVTALSPFVNNLLLLSRLCEIASDTVNSDPPAKQLLLVIEKRARELLGDESRINRAFWSDRRKPARIRFKQGRFDLDLWHTAALERAAEGQRRDSKITIDSVTRLSLQPTMTQLFGKT